jgi:Rrf2 family protein
MLDCDEMFQSRRRAPARGETWLDGFMQVSAKVDYGVRALLVLAEQYQRDAQQLTKADTIATNQTISIKFLEGILTELRHGGFVISQRGAVGGYRLSRDPALIPLADVIRVLDGPLAAVRGLRPEQVAYQGASVHLQDVWVGVRSALRSVLEGVTLADIVSGALPSQLQELVDAPDAWVSRPGYGAN